MNVEYLRKNVVVETNSFESYAIFQTFAILNEKYGFDRFLNVFAYNHKKRREKKEQQINKQNGIEREEKHQK